MGFLFSLCLPWADIWPNPSQIFPISSLLNYHLHQNLIIRSEILFCVKGTVQKFLLVRSRGSQSSHLSLSTLDPAAHGKVLLIPSGMCGWQWNLKCPVWHPLGLCLPWSPAPEIITGHSLAWGINVSKEVLSFKEMEKGKPKGFKSS